MSAGVKKPPLAPKPKLPVSTKPCPPPIAPKPGVLTQPLVSQPSPSTLKRPKPAVAPKPCLSKSTSSPSISHLPSRTSEFHITPDTYKTFEDNVPQLNKKNGILSKTDNSEPNYIIPVCSCGLQVCSNCNHVQNGNATEAMKDLHKDILLNDIFSEGCGSTETRPQGEQEEVEVGEKDQSEAIQKRPKDKPQRQKYSDKSSVNQDQDVKGPNICEQGKSNTHPNVETPTIVSQPSARIIVDVSSTVTLHGSGESAQVLDIVEDNVETPLSLYLDSEVPDPPSKPLPVPQPRKFKKPAFVRQDGVETVTFNQEGQTHSQRDEEEVNSSPYFSVGSEAGTFSLDINGTRQDFIGDNESDAPVPPPRQTSLSPSLQRAVHLTLHKNTSKSLELLSAPEKEVELLQTTEDEEDGYGDFARYPVTHSLPKQVKLGSQPHLERRTFSAEDHPIRRAHRAPPPRKPQRHSLPVPPPPSCCPPAPPAPPHAGAPMRDLPAPPHEKSAWRFSRPSVTFFSRQVPTRCSMPSKSRVPLIGSKQRARSFSAADLAIRTDPHRKSMSFRKLIELRLSVKMLPKMLTKSSLDCTNVESNYTEKQLERTNSCIGDIHEDGEDAAEYENVPLYEEIPEYMNLPFHSARLGWPDGDADDIYEVQDPYHRCHDSDYESGWMRQDVHSEEDEIHSSDEEDNSSTSSKEHLNEVDRQLEEEIKRKKVVHIAQEIMSSEKVFVDVLKLLHIDFRDAVFQATRQNGKAIVEERILNQILYYLPQLYELNKDLLKELEERVAHWTDHQRLSDIFVEKGPYLKMYSTYIRQFDINVALLDEQCRKNPAFAAVVREFEMSPRCANLALKHYLLKPVQRIPQYQLLLTDYLKNLSADSEDHKDTQAALGIVKEVANHANDIMKQGDNFQKLMQIQYSLNGQHEIVQPGRVFLKEGTLMKLSRKVMQPRMFFLFNDALMYTTPVQSGQYRLNSILSLAGMKVSKPSQEAYQNELNIESVERSFILSANSASERDEWLEAIATAIDDYTKKKITFISSRSQEETEEAADNWAPLGSKAPIWIPDLRATMCMICTCEFTLTWRRHHCRACGKVVCQACSINKYYLEYLKNQPARVCDQCFSILQENKDRCATSLSPIKAGAFSFTRKQKKIPAALKEVSANTENSSMSGYLNRSKGNKKQWKRLWFVIKDKVLYTYAASEDVAALESQPLLGFFLREEKNGPAQKLQFKLYHKNTLFYIFKADDIPTAQRWIEAFQEAMILEE
ncbi:FYVE, RhoGEF and PH domain-containing protein 6 [Eucyclogobius newberryi]|uniref:FYVE, RhoGEF and PH domain-containing protein 6 n=1 Tax=Eucyclogobius newberryi TaxID=166745 RepID=UPI003B58EC7A